MKSTGVDLCPVQPSVHSIRQESWSRGVNNVGESLGTENWCHDHTERRGVSAIKQFKNTVLTSELSST